MSSPISTPLKSSSVVLNMPTFAINHYFFPSIRSKGIQYFPFIIVYWQSWICYFICDFLFIFVILNIEKKKKNNQNVFHSCEKLMLLADWVYFHKLPTLLLWLSLLKFIFVEVHVVNGTLSSFENWLQVHFTNFFFFVWEFISRISLVISKVSGFKNGYWIFFNLDNRFFRKRN